MQATLEKEQKADEDMYAELRGLVQGRREFCACMEVRVFFWAA